MTNKDDNVVSEFKNGLYAINIALNQQDLFNKFLKRENNGPNPEAQTAIKYQFELNDGDNYPLHKLAIDMDKDLFDEQLHKGLDISHKMSKY